ncbi:MAG: hypothetical protein HY390_00200 [Deltaproteobacteria bacterium]|nr:hypothetical protein [Deltaproteobacteria bacterium]
MAQDLLKKTVDITQLPKDHITQELSRLLSQKGIQLDNVSLWQLRYALEMYIREVFEDYERILYGVTKNNTANEYWTEEPPLKFVFVQ